MILHAVEVAASGATVHVYTQDTDVLLLALRRVPQLGRNSALIMGTGECLRTVLLQPIYDALEPTKAAALINWHALTGCDTTGHIRGKGKQTCFKAFMTSPPDVVSSLKMLGEGDSPSEEVLDGCEAFLCSLYCPKGVKHSRAISLRWHLFKMIRLVKCEIILLFNAVRPIILSKSSHVLTKNSKRLPCSLSIVSTIYDNHHGIKLSR